MNKKSTAKEIVIGGLLLVSGIILPMAFHIFGMTGPIVLPMHIPILIGGFFLSPVLSLFLGIVTPVISGLLTGMPVLFPMAVIMAIELGAYGYTVSLLTIKQKIKVIPSLIISMVTGRIAAGLAVAVLVQLFGIKMNPFTYVKGAIITGLPGIIIQLIFIPPLICAINKYLKRPATKTKNNEYYN